MAWVCEQVWLPAGHNGQPHTDRDSWARLWTRPRLFPRTPGPGNSRVRALDQLECWEYQGSRASLSGPSSTFPA